MQTFYRGQKIRIHGVASDSPTNIFRVDAVHAPRRLLEAINLATGARTPWVEWDACSDAGNVVGWEFLKSVLSAETVKLLSAFSGFKDLVLREDVALRVLRQQPDLAERLHEQLAIEHMNDLCEEPTDESGLPMPTAADLRGHGGGVAVGGRPPAKVLTEADHALLLAPDEDDLADLLVNASQTAKEDDA